MQRIGPSGGVTNPEPVAIKGDVDRQGEIVDIARMLRLRAAVGPDHSVTINPDDQAALAADLIAAGRRTLRGQAGLRSVW